jgi:hypothetical protein
MILRLTTVHENPGSAGILPAVARHSALDDVACRMPALPFSWQSLMPLAAPRNHETKAVIPSEARNLALPQAAWQNKGAERDSSLRSE